jgi:hypothetical protein
MIHGAESDRIGANAEGQGQDSHKSESGIISENTGCVSQILAYFLEWNKRPLLATHFGDASAISEVASGACSRFEDRETPACQLLHLLIEVSVNLIP